MYFYSRLCGFSCGATTTAADTRMRQRLRSLLLPRPLQAFCFCPVDPRIVLSPTPECPSELLVCHSHPPPPLPYQWADGKRSAPEALMVCL